MKLRKYTDTVVVHCSATPPSLDWGAEEIERIHVKENGWRDIGYHLVIRRNGLAEFGRHFLDQGAHVAGHNHHTVGICLVGGVSEDTGEPEDNFTNEQQASLIYWCAALKTVWPKAKWKGHRDFSPDLNKDGKITEDEWMKACPSFDVAEWCGAEKVL